MDKIIANFSPSRFWLTFRNDLRKQQLPALYAALAVLFFMILNYLFRFGEDDFSEELAEFHETFFPMVFYIGGFVLASAAFFEFWKKEQGIHYLMNPSSTFEKYLSKWFITLILYTILGIAVYWIWASLCNGIVYMFLPEVAFISFNPFSEYFLLILQVFWVLHSVFFLGAVFWGKYAFLKTPASLVLVGIGVLAFLGLMAVIIIPGFSFSGPPEDVHLSREFQNSVGDFMEKASNFFFFWLLAPFLWVVAFIRLTEKEV